MNSLLAFILLVVTLVGGVFLLLPTLTRDLSGGRLWHQKNLTVGRVVGLIISITSIILLYQTFT